jgi:iron complex transport system substrate-binding protein
MRHLVSLLTLTLSTTLATAQTFPVTVDSCGESLTFNAPPKRAVIHDLNMTEMALALKLNQSMVGVTGITGWYKTGPEFKAALGNIPELAPKNPTLENIVAVNPDFFFAGWNYGMKVGGEVTPASLIKYNIKTLVLSESCIHVNKQRPVASMDLLYADYVKLGTIFGKESIAKNQVSEWKARLTKLPQQPRQAGEPPHGKPWRHATHSFWCCWTTRMAMG